MKVLKNVTTILFILIFCLSKLSGQIINNSVWKDNNGKEINAHGGSILFHSGKYYWYGEDRISDFSKVNCAFIRTDTLAKNKANIIGLSRGGFHCYSSTDLRNWVDEGVVLPPNFTNQNSEMAYGSVIERPKVLYNGITKKFVMHFKLKTRLTNEVYAKYGSPMRYGVAVSSSATGPFVFDHTYLPGFTAQGGGDETIFVESDGTAYLIFAAKPGYVLYYSKLSNDYLNPVGGYRPCVGIANGIEAPAVAKINGIYHLFASGVKGYNPTAPKYAYSSSITGPWTELMPDQSPYSPIATSSVNPSTGINASVTFGGQTTYVVQLPNNKNIIMYDVWNTKDIPNSTYFWLPIIIDKNNNLNVKWHNAFDIVNF